MFRKIKISSAAIFLLLVVFIKTQKDVSEKLPSVLIYPEEIDINSLINSSAVFKKSNIETFSPKFLIKEYLHDHGN